MTERTRLYLLPCLVIGVVALVIPNHRWFVRHDHDAELGRLVQKLALSSDLDITRERGLYVIGRSAECVIEPAIHADLLRALQVYDSTATAYRGEK